MNAHDRQIENNRYNMNKLYKLGDGRPAISKALTPALFETLKAILKFANDHEPQILDYVYGQAVYTLTTGRTTYQLRGRKTVGVSNRHFNYLCAMGLLTKIIQSTNLSMSHLLTTANKEFMSEGVSEDEHMKTPMNTFGIQRWTPFKLNMVEEQTQILLDNNITAGNISSEKLCIAGLYDIADRIYYNNNKIYWKNREIYKAIKQFILNSIDANGYCTKSEIYKGVPYTQKQIEHILKLYKAEWQTELEYGPPTKEHKKQYGITDRRWIFTLNRQNRQRNTGRPRPITRRTRADHCAN